MQFSETFKRSFDGVKDLGNFILMDKYLQESWH